MHLYQNIRMSKSIIHLSLRCNIFLKLICGCVYNPQEVRGKGQTILKTWSKVATVIIQVDVKLTQGLFIYFWGTKSVRPKGRPHHQGSAKRDPTRWGGEQK